MATKTAIIAIIASLNTLGADIPPEAASLWKEVLAPIDDALLRAAFTRFLREHKWGPRIMPGALYQAAMSIQREQFPSPGAAWEMARAFVRGEGKVSSGPVATACEQIGWMALNDLRVDDVATRARFLEFYRDAVSAEASEQLGLKAPPPREALPEPNTRVTALMEGVGELPIYDGSREAMAQMYGVPEEEDEDESE